MAKARKPLTKAQIITTLAEKTELPKNKVKELLEKLAELSYSEAKVGFTIPGIGKLVLQKYKKRKGRNPQTGEPLTIPARIKLKFRISKIAKDMTEPKKK